MSRRRRGCPDVLFRFGFTRLRVAFSFPVIFAVGTFRVSFSAAAQSPASSGGASAQAQPANGPDPVLLGLDYYRQGKCKDAEPIFEGILLRAPKDIAIRKLLGQCYLQDKNLDEAQKQFQLVLEADPRDVEAYQGLIASMGEMQKQHFEQERKIYQSRAAKAEELRSNHEFALAGKLIKARRLEEAQGVLIDLLKSHPDFTAAQVQLAEIYSTTRQFDQAAEVYIALAERLKGSPDFLLRAAENCEWGKDYSRATQYYRLYLRKKPSSTQALLAMGRILMQEKNYAEAVPYYRLYLEENPRDTEVRTTLADILMWSRHWSEAASEFKRLVATRPSDVRLRLSLAQCYDQMGMRDSALAAYEDVLKLDPRNPQALKARSEYLRYFDELPRQQGYAAVARKDFDAAARFFIQYSQRHPEDSGMLLEIARVYSWVGRREAAAKYYEEYLQQAPADLAIVREFAQLEIDDKRYAEARKCYASLTQGSQATQADYVGLLHTYTWAGDLEGAQPVARRILAIDPNDAEARGALSEFAEQNRLAAEKARREERGNAERLAAAGRYPEAIAAYRGYMAHYGADRTTELLIPRLYSWGKDWTASIREYQAYLQKYPDDTTARLELAQVENWSGHYRSAEGDYRAVLQQKPQDLTALTGITEVEEYQQKDPFNLRKDYLDLLRADPGNSLAEKGLEKIHSDIAPALTFDNNDFADSDDVFRSLSSMEMSLPFPGRVKLTPIYKFGFFRQNLADTRLTDTSNAAGGRIEFSRLNGDSLSAELGDVRWDEHEKVGAIDSETTRGSLYAHAVAGFRLGKNNTLGFEYVHQDAVYDLTTVQVLEAGVMQDAIMVSYQRPISERVRFWTSAGMNFYTSGTLGNEPRNTQPRLSAILAYQAKSWLTLGYATRLTGFAEASRIYFSPTLYQTHGLTYSIDRTLAKSLFVSADGEFDYGRIGTHRMAVPVGPSASTTGASVNSFELAFVPRLNWRMRHGITLRGGLRFSQGLGGSSLNAPGTIYRTGGAELSVQKVF